MTACQPSSSTSRLRACIATPWCVPRRSAPRAAAVTLRMTRWSGGTLTTRLGESPGVDMVVDYLEAFAEQMPSALAAGASSLSVDDTAIACRALTVDQITDVLRRCGRLDWFHPGKIVGSDTEAARRGFTALGVAVGTDEYVRADVRS